MVLKKYKKFNIPEETEQFRYIKTIEFRDGLLDVLTALVNFYSDNFSLNALWDYILTVGNLIYQKAQSTSGSDLQIKDLENAVYQNSDVKNIPWRDIFNEALRFYDPTVVKYISLDHQRFY